MFHGSIKAFLTLLILLFALTTLSILTLCALQKPLSATRRFIFKLVMLVNNMSLTVEGTRAQNPLLLVSNHCSYLDVILLGSLEDICFTPKSDVRKWPVIGYTVALFGAIFVSRNPRDAKQVQQQVLEGLRQHRPLSLFPEGTTNNGHTLVPFKPSLFNIVKLWEGDTLLTIQPVTIQYKTLNGKPIQGAEMDAIAWYGDMDFFPHLWQFMQQKSMHAHITFHPPLVYDKHTDRKTLAMEAENIVRKGLGIIETPTS